jgi:ATP-dependent DNA helicase RecG
MTIEQLNAVLDNLCSLTAENEIVEFKEAKNSYDFSKLGK